MESTTLIPAFALVLEIDSCSQTNNLVFAVMKLVGNRRESQVGYVTSLDGSHHCIRDFR